MFSYSKLRYLKQLTRKARVYGYELVYSNECPYFSSTKYISTSSTVRAVKRPPADFPVFKTEDPYAIPDSQQIDEHIAKIDEYIVKHGYDQPLKSVRKYKYESAGALHVPVLKDEVLQYLDDGTKNQTLLDMTFGAGGHTKAILNTIPSCHILALDRDPAAYNIACALAEERPGRITPLLGRFSDLPQLLSGLNISPGSLDGALMDVGSSSMQFDQSERGFMLSQDGPLDMRMDGNRVEGQPTAADVVNMLEASELADIIKRYGEDRRAKKIGQAIVEARLSFGRIETTQQLADIIEAACQGGFGYDSLQRYSHTATKTFQALRIFVNNELNEINSGVHIVHKYLKVGGKCAAISFHSLEDRIVKRHFNDIDLDSLPGMSRIAKERLKSRSAIFTEDELDQITQKKWQRLHKRVITPGDEEQTRNPRSRSSRLRVAVKL